MSKQMLEYMLNSTAEAVRIMARDNTCMQAFDYGVSTISGTKYVVVIAVIPEENLHTPLFESKPLEP